MEVIRDHLVALYGEALGHATVEQLRTHLLPFPENRGRASEGAGRRRRDLQRGELWNSGAGLWRDDPSRSLRELLLGADSLGRLSDPDVARAAGAAQRLEYSVLVLFAMVGMMLMASARDLVVLFLGIELMSICLYVLAGFSRTRREFTESALKYLLLGSFTTGFLLYGIALIYGVTGTTNLQAIAMTITEHSANPVFLIGSAMLIIALSFKVAAVPFHMWAPDVYEGAPTTVSVS